MDSPRLTYRRGAALYTPTSSLSDQPSTTGGLDGPVTEGLDDDVSGAALGATATATFEGTAAVGFGAGAGTGAGAGFRTALRDLNHLITISIHTSYRPAGGPALVDSFPNDFFDCRNALLDFEQPAPPKRDHAAGDGYLL